MPRRAALVTAAVVLLVVAGLVAWRLGSRATTFEDAVAMVPSGTERATWTDWGAVRRQLDVDLDTDSGGEDVQALLDEAFSRDLTSGSALNTSAVVMHEELGLSPATLDWELFAQSPDGAVEVLRLGEDTDLDGLRDRLESLGWERPASDDGIWVGGADVLARVGPGLTPELQHLAVLDDGLVLSSDQTAYLERAVDVVGGGGDRVAGLAEVAASLEDPVTAVVYTGSHACEKLAMAQADADAQAEADQLVEAAGGVHPLSAFAMGTLREGDVRVALEVEDADEAEAEAEARARLASGPSPGQGGEFSDRFEVTEAGARGRVVTLDLRPVEGEYVLSDLSSGPVLFATC
ncbi:MAG: hypothetical protein AVDCRST_MAG60-2562 [uncultured Nocardioides sp.]|uniref:Uncharacterized protein n=1 Tax=uncultured Nocardioides sp. TaxID=198441 RepID=A0A6J4PAK5_9ACTN|nr:MAG: hypothetical protein AVDCRST_MAG60-2562 [uncultured Nocardioides sp.]